MAYKMISDNIALLTEVGAVVSFSRTPSVTDKTGNGGRAEKIKTNGKSVEIWTWGKNNLLPQEREALVQDNNIVPELISTKRDITLGQGLMCYREVFEVVDGKMKRRIEEVERPAAAVEFFDKVDEWDYLMTSARNLMFHANVFTEYVRTVGGKIDTMKALECRHVRPQRKDNRGKINNWYISGNWKEAKNKPEFLPFGVPNYTGEDKKQNLFVLHTKDDLLCDDYLGIPTWWGDRSWIECANEIPIFHISNLRNGYTIRYHIEIPKDYFMDNTASQVSQTEKDAAKRNESEARAAFLQTLNDFLAGSHQAGRAIITDYELNKQLGKDYPGIKIKPITVDLKDEALLKLFERSNDANISAQGIHPTLAAIQTQGKLSSGSEIRNALNMYVAIKTPMKRAVLLKPIQLVHKINGWGDGIKWGFRDIELQTIDEAKTGLQEAAPAV